MSQKLADHANFRGVRLGSVPSKELPDSLLEGIEFRIFSCVRHPVTKGAEMGADVRLQVVTYIANQYELELAVASYLNTVYSLQKRLSS